MADIIWDHVTPLKRGTELEELEVKYNFKLPEDLKKYMKEKNGGRANKEILPVGEYEFLFGGFLSLNKEDIDNIYDDIDMFEISENQISMFPFAIDPAGDYFCIKDGKVVFFEHEDDSVYYIADSFSEMLEMLELPPEDDDDETYDDVIITIPEY